MSRYSILEAEALQAELESLPGWRDAGGRIEAKFKFSSFRHAVAFINLLAMECEAADHHPDLSNTYDRITLSFSTHDAGNRVTDMDVKLARYASKAASDLQGVVYGH